MTMPFHVNADPAHYTNSRIITGALVPTPEFFEFEKEMQGTCRIWDRPILTGANERDGLIRRYIPTVTFDNEADALLYKLTYG